MDASVLSRVSDKYRGSSQLPTSLREFKGRTAPVTCQFMVTLFFDMVSRGEGLFHPFLNMSSTREVAAVTKVAKK
eukprot:1159024-Pelagomonas_calceolata.AAC.2